MPVTEIKRRELVNRLVATIGEESTETLMQCLLTEGRDQLATKDDLKEALKVYATKDDLKEALKAYATKEDLKEALKVYATKDDLKEALKAYATKDDLKEALKAYATKEDLKEALKAYATKDDLKILENTLRTEFKAEIAMLRGHIDLTLGKQLRIHVAMLTGVLLTLWGTLVVVAVG